MIQIYLFKNYYIFYIKISPSYEETKRHLKLKLPFAMNTKNTYMISFTEIITEFLSSTERSVINGLLALELNIVTFLDGNPDIEQQFSFIDARKVCGAAISTVKKSIEEI